MKKIIKPEVRCKYCGAIKEYEKSDEFCDECEKNIKWDEKNGYNLSIDYIKHNYDGLSRFNFCSVKCGLRWLLKHGKENLETDDDFLTLDYWHLKNLNILLNFLDKDKIRR